MLSGASPPISGIPVVLEELYEDRLCGPIVVELREPWVLLSNLREDSTAASVIEDMLKITQGKMSRKSPGLTVRVS